MANNLRLKKIESEIKKQISQALISTINNQKIRSSIITEVKVSADISHATIYFIHSTNENQETSKQDIELLEKILNKSKGVFQSQLSKHLALRIVPKIRFVYDTLPAKSSKLDSLIDQVTK